ncbi:MAG: hypothetical protein K8F93_00410 [Burkholderiales bacterium]|nr:hypothetical protein [Burkholderiales bacterium]
MNTTSSGVKRLVYKEIVLGDIAKAQAQSNITQSGGGARDLRFNPYTKFVKVFSKMLPTAEAHPTDAGKTVFTGGVRWEDSGGMIHTGKMEFWPPTTARPFEGRIAKIHDLAFFGAQLATLTTSKTDRLFVFIMQDDQGVVYLRYALESALRAGTGGDAGTHAKILACLDANRSDKSSIMGYIDFETSEVYCDADG